MLMFSLPLQTDNSHHTTSPLLRRPFAGEELFGCGIVASTLRCFHFAFASRLHFLTHSVELNLRLPEEDDLSQQNEVKMN